MSFGDDEDILQDFLVEAGEILERLGQQLVDLEQDPEDKDLLNAIFRGFHTVKGGAGFLALHPMVQCCHVTENLFDILRNGKRSVTPELMDVVLQALDMVNQQYELISAREPLPEVDPDLLDALSRLVSCEDLVSAAQPLAPDILETPIVASEVITPVAAPAANPDAPLIIDGDMTDAEFERLLDAIQAAPSDGARESNNHAAVTESSATPSVPVTSTSHSSSDITEDEFEALLDQLHGSGKAPGASVESATTSSSSTSLMPPTSVTAGDEITDAEFESLLDQLHGQGKGPGSVPETKAPAASVSLAGAGDLITDDEFDSLLDQLHGVGKGPGGLSSAGQSSSATAPSLPVAAPASAISPKVEPAPRKAPAKTETAKAADKDAPVAETTVRVDTQRLDDIMNMVGELVLVRNRLVRLGDSSHDEQLVKAVANLDVVTADLQTAVMKTRMQPIKKVFGRFPRVVRDLARTLQKEINLELVGEDTDLDKNLVEALADPLVHLVRNSVDHGIELPSVREQAGKSRVGLVVLSAEQEGDHILLTISDDGAGMDPVKLRRIAVDKGLYDEDGANRLSDTEAYNLIFAPGFSTKKEISDVSGRGVGMDVVKTKITQLNGSVEIKSEMGKGTQIIIKVPLTLAIMPTLMFMLAEQTFAFPLVSVNEIFYMDLSKTHVVDGQECIAIRDQAIPLFFMKQWLVHGVVTERPANAHVVIITVGSRRVGFVVDQLIGQEEVVIKPLGKMLQGTPGMAGATITGDGTIALILDVPSLLRRYANNNI